MDYQINDKTEIISKIEKEDVEKIRYSVNLIYDGIIELIKKYGDINPKYHNLVAFWIIGTYLHKEFNSYPILFLNAPKQSGKSRIMNLILSISRNGKLLMSVTESGLFRLGNDVTLGIDEFESLNSKNNQAIREQLNASYKKGIKVQRQKKVKTFTGEKFEVEEYEPYKPIVVANIWGMNDVLADRSIPLPLERSDNDRIIHLLEDFDENHEIKVIKEVLNLIQCRLCSVCLIKNIEKKWNRYVNDRNSYTTTLHTYHTLTTLHTLKYNINKEELVVANKPEDIKTLEFFNKIYDSDIKGRQLEIFFPLFIIAEFISRDLLLELIDSAREITLLKKEDDIFESKDISLLDFVSRCNSQKYREYVNIKEFTLSFREFLGDVEGEDKWLNPEWVGRSLKRLHLVTNKRRVNKGIEIILNIDKAVDKIKLYNKE